MATDEKPEYPKYLSKEDERVLAEHLKQLGWDVQKQIEDLDKADNLKICQDALFKIMNSGVTQDGNTLEATIAYEALGKSGYWHE